MHIYRSHTCAQLRKADVGSTVRLSGWIHRKRDHGNLLFVDLRDHYGLTQIVTDVDSEAFKVLEKARAESVVTITGDVVARAAETVNANLPTGEIEVRAREVTLQSAAQELPMPVFGDAEYPEDIRLRYRFLDLRRERLHNNIVLRSNVISSVRRRMIEQGFTEFQTPILTASSPEGARDYLVPSRVHPGKFYALPQAPQMFKQLLMVAGFDRYFQIAPCFRDEDARADRSPGEFYQLDFEMSFVTQDDVFNAIEPVLHGLFEEFANGRKVSPAPFPRIPYREAMLKYGSDKPDLRNPLVITDVSEHFKSSGFGLFERMLAGRYLRAKRQHGGVALISVISVVAITLAVMALIITMSVMNGFREELFDRILGVNGHAVIRGYGGDILFTQSAVVLEELISKFVFNGNDDKKTGDATQSTTEAR